MEQVTKKSIATLYNQVSKEIFGIGVHDQKIDMIDNKIMIIARTKRLPALDALSDEYSELVSSLDAALSSTYKRLLKEKLEILFDVKITSLFRDYDTEKGIACTVICFDNDIAE